MSAEDAVRSAPAQSREIARQAPGPSSSSHCISRKESPRASARLQNQTPLREGQPPRSARHSPSTSHGKRRETATSMCWSSQSIPTAYTRPAIRYSAAQETALCAAPSNFSPPTAQAATARPIQERFPLAPALANPADATISRTIRVPPKSIAVVFPAAPMCRTPLRSPPIPTDSRRIHLRHISRHRSYPGDQDLSPAAPELLSQSEK